MKRSLALALALALPSPALAGDLHVRFANVTDDTGHMMVAVCTEETYPELNAGGCAPAARAPVAEDMVVTFEALPPGAYGISVYHDVDDDGQLKSNFLGIPREPLGASNDARGNMGPPSFEDMSFEIGDDDLELLITMYRL